MAATGGSWTRVVPLQSTAASSRTGSANIGWGVAVNDGSTFNMYGGTVCGNRVASNYGAGVDVYKGTFTMYGGAIKGNVATYGGGVFVNDNCAFTMYGGEIDGNSAVRSGGGVNVSSNGAFTMAGGAITDNGGHRQHKQR